MRTQEQAGYRESLRGTLSLCKDAAVLTHQNTVRKCRRLCQGTLRLSLYPACSCCVLAKVVPFQLRVKPEKKQRKREMEEWDWGHCFGWRFYLTVCPVSRGKLPWTAILGMLRHGRHCIPTRPVPIPFPDCLVKTPSKTMPPIPSLHLPLPRPSRHHPLLYPYTQKRNPAHAKLPHRQDSIFHFLYSLLVKH